MALGSQDYGIAQDVLLEKRKKELVFGSSSTGQGHAACVGWQRPVRVATLPGWAPSGPVGSSCLAEAGLSLTVSLQLKPLSMADKADKRHSKPEKPELFKSAQEAV